MLKRSMSGAAQARLHDALALLSERFQGAGFAPVDIPHLFAGETLLDLYGEDLRARAFLFPDAGRGNELCLRPDFTVPVALAHGAGGWERAASYAYQGQVFRNQPADLGRPTEYMQAGIEAFGEADSVVEDARIFALLHGALVDLGIKAPEVLMGDLSIPFALLDALEMPARRRARLRRHFWRQNRFQDLIERACAGAQPGPGPSDDGAEILGIRSVEAVAQRLALLAEEAQDPPMPRRDADLIGAVLGLECPAAKAPAQLRSIIGGVGIDAVIDRLEARLDVLADKGLDPAAMRFNANFGRILEYYDGFVFEMRAEAQGEHPPLAGGGRYDALTERLGAARQIPAIGGMIRPESVLEGLV